MTNDFQQLASSPPYEEAREELNAALRTGFASTQELVPVGTGDKRRPAGALRDSGRFSSDMDAEVWEGSVEYGTTDDVLPYAVWARWKHHRKTGIDYLGDGMESAVPDFDRAVDAPWRAVFNITDDLE